MQTFEFDIEKNQDNTGRLKAYAGRTRAAGDKGNSAGKTESGEE